MLVAIGLAVGVVGALSLSRLMQGLLFGVAPHDPITLARRGERSWRPWESARAGFPRCARRGSIRALPFGRSSSKGTRGRREPTPPRAP